MGVALLVVGWIAWFVLTPADLPTSDDEVSAAGVAGTPVYVGMFTAPGDFERRLHLSGVKVHTEASAELKVTPLLCTGASIGVTTAPDRFCEELGDPEGGTLGAGDSIVIEIAAEAPVEAHVDRIEIAYREGPRWSTQPAGVSGADVTIGAH